MKNSFIKFLVIFFTISHIYCNNNTLVPKNVEWINIVGVEKDEQNNLKKSTSNAWGNAGASSKNSLPEDKDGWVEMVADKTNSNRMLGLSEKDVNQNFKDIKYAIYPTIKNTIMVYEKGIKKGAFGSYSNGDKLKVQRIKGEIQYFKNDSLLYTSVTASTSILVIDVALHTKGSTIKDVKSSF